MLEDSLLQPHSALAKVIAGLIGGVVIAGGGVGYAIHEHHAAQTMAAQKQTLAAQNEQVTAQLALTRTELNTLEAKVNSLTSGNQAMPGETKPSPEVPTNGTATNRRAVAHRSSAQDARFKKMQSQLDAQDKAIDDTRTDLASAKTELGGSIARTHDELVVLEKKGEHNYFEFDIQKSKQFKREGPVGISLRKANTKHQYADLTLLVDDRNLTQKHVNLFQPAMFYEPDSPQPIEIVINDISKDHIHGYVSAPKYRQSELAAMSNAGGNGTAGSDQAANSGQGDNGIVGDVPANGSGQPAPRKKLTLPSSDASQQ
jgi:uncharacterized coiled-coil protein SlyX